MSWNLGGIEPVDKITLFNFEKGKNAPDIVVVGL